MHSLVDAHGCRVVVSDDGVGLPSGVRWPEPGKLSAMIVRSLRENAKARVEVDPTGGKGTTVTILFARAGRGRALRWLSVRRVAARAFFDTFYEAVVMPQGDGEIVRGCLQALPKGPLRALVVDRFQ